MFAAARGVCLLSVDWVYESVCQESWANPFLHLHGRFFSIYRSLQLCEGGIEERRMKPKSGHSLSAVFRDVPIWIVDSVSPTTDVLCSLLQAAGGIPYLHAAQHEPANMMMFGENEI
jgi:hypothetical protein